MRGIPGVAIGGVADQRQVIRDQRRHDAKLLAHGRGVANTLGAAVDLHDAVPAHALREVLVGGPDADLVDARVLGGDARRRRQRIVGFHVDHRPDDDAHRPQRVLQRMELRQQRGLDAAAVL
jgi:hypothetical protein